MRVSIRMIECKREIEKEIEREIEREEGTEEEEGLLCSTLRDLLDLSFFSPIWPDYNFFCLFYKFVDFVSIDDAVII